MPLVRNPIALFEENYRLLQAMLAELGEGENVLQLLGSDAKRLLTIVVLERCRYTTMLSLQMPFVSGGMALPDLRMQVRVYHDARVAEVVAYQGCERIPAPYQVNRHAPYLLDEKRQINLLLHELLRYCRRSGYRALLEEGCR